ncbi:hypothetical protein HKX48_000482 [Thoreauomyces humboldtii]|nr:hypothetical protein HKX48_000482 [Thoreauomyces humboldtii]
MSTSQEPPAVQQFDYSKIANQDSATVALERATGPPVEALLKQADLIPRPSKTKPVRLLDNACGAGLVASRYFSALQDRENVTVVCGDLEAHWLEGIKKRMGAEGWSAEAKVVDAQAIDFPDGEFTHVVTSFGYQVFPDPLLALRETFRVLKSGGKSSGTTWASVGWLPKLQEVNTSYPTPPPFLGDWAFPDRIRRALEESGFIDIKVQVLEFEVLIESLEVWAGQMRFVAAKALENGVEAEMMRRQREKTGEGQFKLPGWKALIWTGTKP